MTDNRAEYEKMLERYYFKDLYSFIKDSTGVAVTIAYIILILTSMAYLSVFYSHFDIEIIKLVTLEDILTTPIKNPNILIALVTIVGAMYIVDVGNRYHARLNLNYFDKEMPWHIKLMKYITWIPKSEKGNKGFILALILVFISTYMYFFADIKARAIQKGQGYEVYLSLADTNDESRVTLLGATSLYVLVYDKNSKQSTVHQIESVASMRPVTEE
ncbi:MAG: hypothetical protein VW874_10880 [Gammaproteobacteria bacterium]